MQPDTGNGPATVLRGFLALVLLGVVMLLSRLATFPLLTGLSLDLRLFVSLALTPVTILVIILVAAPRPFGRSLALAPAPVRWGSTLGTALGLILLVLVLTGASALMLRGLHLGTGSERQQMMAAILHSHSSLVRWSLLILAVVAAPVMEELFFRGLVYSAFQAWGQLAARLISAFTFALAHMEPVGFLGFFAVGWYLTGLRARNSSVVPCIALHATYNAVLVVVTLLLLAAQRRLAPGALP